MTFEHRGELRADPGSAPGQRNIEATRPRRSIWPSIAVVAAAAAFGGVIWYAYQTTRPPSGNGLPPLVKADAGPVKVKPDQPGGQEIPFQDSTVYDHINQGTQGTTVERILPPPEAPVDRRIAASNQTDQGANPQGGVPAPPPADTSPAALAPAPGAPVEPISPQRTLSHPVPAVTPHAVLIDTSRQKPMTANSALAPSQPATVKPLAPIILPATPKLQSTKIMSPKPGAAVAQIAELEDKTPQKKSASETKLSKPTQAAPASGKVNYRIQLSSVKDADVIPSEWSGFTRRLPELSALTASAVRADLPGKGIFYRLQAGPLDEAGAKAMCERVRAQGLGCIVIKPRG